MNQCSQDVFNKKRILNLIKETKELDYILNYYSYKLLGDICYLQTAYKQIHDKSDDLDKDQKIKFLRYPIPIAIVEDWEKVNK